jgi:hypothetical protein
MPDLNELLRAARAHGEMSGQAARALALETSRLSALREQEAELLRRFNWNNFAPR